MMMMMFVLQGHLYIHDWILDDGLFPPRMPVGSYLAYVILTTNINGQYKPVINVHVNLKLRNISFKPHAWNKIK